MTERVIASRPSLEQVKAIVQFMEKHPALALGQMRGLEAREECKKLWCRIAKSVNCLEGPERPVKSWIKFWADKKSLIRSKVLASGDPNILTSNTDKQIFDLFLAEDVANFSKKKSSEDQNIGEDKNYAEDQYSFEDQYNFEEQNNTEDRSNIEDHTEPQMNVKAEPLLVFDEPATDIEERQMLVMEKLVNIMGEQANAMSRLAHASQLNARSMEKLAGASEIQARAIERLATSFESVGALTHDVRNAIVDIDNTMKRYYGTPDT